MWVFFIYSFFFIIPILYNLYQGEIFKCRINIIAFLLVTNNPVDPENPHKFDVVIPSDTTHIVITFTNFFFGFFIFVPMVSMWLQVSQLLQSMVKMTEDLIDFTKERFTLEKTGKTESDATNTELFSSTTPTMIKEWQDEMVYTQHKIMCKLDYIKLSLGFAILVSRIASVTVSLMALFNKSKIESPFVQVN